MANDSIAIGYIVVSLYGQRSTCLGSLGDAATFRIDPLVLVLPKEPR
jgi:hypothetical protein